MPEPFLNFRATLQDQVFPRLRPCKGSNDFLKQNSFAAAAYCKSSFLFTLLRQSEDSSRMEMNGEQMEVKDNPPPLPKKKQRSIVPGQIWMPLNAVENMWKKQSDESEGGSIRWNPEEILT